MTEWSESKRFGVGMVAVAVTVFIATIGATWTVAAAVYGPKAAALESQLAGLRERVETNSTTLAVVQTDQQNFKTTFEPEVVKLREALNRLDVTLARIETKLGK